MEISERINELFEKYIAGISTPAEWEELLVLVAGISESDTETLSAPLQRLWQQARDRTLPSRAHLLDKEKMYAAITRSHETSQSAPVRRLPWGRLAIAAAVLGVLVAGGIRIFHSRAPAAPAPDSSIAMGENVKAGIDKATLILEDGRQIMLDSAATGDISQQGKTRIINLNGQLSYIDQQKGAAKGHLTYNTMVTARANQYHLILPDGTKVWLNAASSIRFPTSFIGNDRTVDITGEAYFEIARNPSKPFYVKSGTTSIAVLGTHFNVNAYADEQGIKTSLLQGSVRVSNGKSSTLLAPGQEAVSHPDQQVTTAAGNVALAIAWKEGFFQFDQAPLPVILRQIARWYDLDVSFTGPIPDRVFKGKIQRSLPLSAILHLLEKGGIHSTLTGRTLIITQ